jgi:hypothetical protein
MHGRNLKIVLLSISLLLTPRSLVSGGEIDYNELVLESLAAMPSGGGYSTSGSANHALSRSVFNLGGRLLVTPSTAMPSYCSGATYLVFLKVMATLQSRGQLMLPPQLVNMLRPSGQPDGRGVWGHWNANGPGTARLFYELGLGENFTDLSRARAGDFLKIFWNDGIGASEHGHSVIYLGKESKQGSDMVTFWSSNIPGGFGRRSVPLVRIHRMLFSRLEHPEAILKATSIPLNDSYLASLERRSSTSVEMDHLCGLGTVESIRHEEKSGSH